MTDTELLADAKKLIDAIIDIADEREWPLKRQWFAELEAWDNAYSSRAKRVEELSASEALYGFTGWLTSNSEMTIMSSRHNAAIIAELVDRFCKANNLSAPREEWSNGLKHPINYGQK